MANNRCLSSTNTIFNNLFEGLGTTSLIYLIGNALSNLLTHFDFDDELSNFSIYTRVLFLLGFTAVSGCFGYRAYVRNNLIEEKQSQMNEELRKLRMELDAVKLRARTWSLEPEASEEVIQQTASATDRQSLLSASETISYSS